MVDKYLFAVTFINIPSCIIHNGFVVFLLTLLSNGFLQVPAVNGLLIDLENRSLQMFPAFQLLG